MSKIKSLADQLRDQMSKPAESVTVKRPKVVVSKNSVPKVAAVSADEQIPDILSLITSYNSSANKSMLHVKLDPDTAKLVGHFKMATGIDNIKLGAFAIRHLFDTHPELKTHIKNYIQNLDL